MATYQGSLGPDTMLSGFDVLYGLDGQDYLVAVSDERGYVEGGTGDDGVFLFGSPGELYGGGGNDIVGGWELGDVLSGGAGNDVVAGGFTAFSGDGTLEAVGPSGADVLGGDGGSDALYGLDGNDVVYGGDGDDRGTVTTSMFTPVDVPGGLWGGDGDDLLDGGAGDDDLHGEGGSDVLIGGVGADRFFFDTPAGGGVDRIRDFDRGEDTIMLSASDFSGVGDTGALKGKFFAKGKKAADKNDHVLYDQKSGKVLFDADGKGGSKAVLFAQVDKGTALSTSDFDVVA